MDERDLLNPKRGSALASFVLEDVKPNDAPRVSERGGDARPGHNAAYSRALVEAHNLYPNDGIARHRYASRAAERGQQIASSLDDSRQMTDPLDDSPGDDLIVVGPKLREFLEDGR